MAIDSPPSRPQLFPDTHPDAARVVVEALRAMTPSVRLRHTFRLINDITRISTQVKSHTSGVVSVTEPNVDDDFRSLVAAVANAFQVAGVTYYLCGSIASSAWGVRRSTIDADVVAKMSLNQVAAFIDEIPESLYFSESMIKEAIAHRHCFNLVNTSTGQKVDVYIAKRDDFASLEFERIQQHEVAFPSGTITLPLASAEDTIIRKLKWYADGEQVSERQWTDVLGVLEVQANNLDHDYLTHWANELGVAELLKEARRQSL